MTWWAPPPRHHPRHAAPGPIRRPGVLHPALMAVLFAALMAATALTPPR
jgi:hypothetical protein